jgi:GNAT superfamily N-acetyltransferase
MPYVDLALARRLEDAQAWRSIEYAQARRTLSPDVVAVVPVAGGYAVCSGAGLPVNRATGLGMNGPVTPSDLDLVAQFFHSRGMASRIDLCPLADRSLVDLLRANGYRLEGFLNVLFRAISDCEPDGAGLARPSPDVQVRQISSQDRELWLHTVAQGFSGSEDPPQEMLDILAPNFDSQIAACFLASIDGEPAGGAATVTHRGAVELCSDSTRPAFRNRGVQNALLRARLAAAREAGCDLAMALTTPGTVSQRNIERAGLCLAYTRAEMVQEGAGTQNSG